MTFVDKTLYGQGSRVYWNDPDEGIGSRYDIVEKVTSSSLGEETTYMLCSGTEAFEYELQPARPSDTHEETKGELRATKLQVVILTDEVRALKDRNEDLRRSLTRGRAYARALEDRLSDLQILANRRMDK